MEVYEQDRMYLSLSLLGRGSLGWRTEDSLILPTPWQTRGKQFSLVSDYFRWKTGMDEFPQTGKLNL